MNEVEIVALWIGLIAGIAGIVLSVVAITFAILVDRRSSKVSDHTITSLQKIESAVERLSDDTRELIKAGWDKMLGTVDRSVSPQTDLPSKEIAEGIAAELREELGLAGESRKAESTFSPEFSQRMNELVDTLQNSLGALLESGVRSGRISDTIDRAVDLLGSLSTPAQALLQALKPMHLTKAQYVNLRKSDLIGPALLELRKAGILVPVLPYPSLGHSSPCYHFSPGFYPALPAVLAFLPDIPKNVIESISDELQKVGYSPED